MIILQRGYKLRVRRLAVVTTGGDVQFSFDEGTVVTMLRNGFGVIDAAVASKPGATAKWSATADQNCESRPDPGARTRG